MSPSALNSLVTSKFTNEKLTSARAPSVAFVSGRFINLPAHTTCGTQSSMLPLHYLSINTLFLHRLGKKKKTRTRVSTFSTLLPGTSTSKSRPHISIARTRASTVPSSYASATASRQNGRRSYAAAHVLALYRSV